MDIDNEIEQMVNNDMHMSTVLLLDKHKDLFKNEESFRQFAQILEGAVAGEQMRLILSGERLLAALISTEDAQERLRERIVKRLSSNPASLTRLKENDVQER